MKITPYGDPLLRKQAEKVEDFDDNLKQLINDMHETMQTAAGIGLAAPQVGLSKRFFVADWSNLEDEEDENREKGLVAYINPVITNAGGEIANDSEGCLSLPEITAKVLRPDEIELTYQNLAGEEINEKLNGFPARVVQHECDHLEGILFIDRISKIERLKFKSKLLDLLSGKTKPFDGARIDAVSEQSDEEA